MEGQKNLSDSDVTLKNIEALSEESNNQTQLWIREDEDCIHTFTGAINATITVSLFGIPTKIKLDGNGKFEYKYGNGKTTCTANGQEQCEARYCPSLN
jgi:hypothetical protein